MGGDLLRAVAAAVLAGLAGGVALAADGPPFASGEATTLALRFLGLPAAQATARLLADAPLDGRPTLRLRVEVETNRVTSLFYHVRNAYDIHLDAETLRPLEVEKRVDERKYRTTLRSTYPPPGASSGAVYDFFAALLVLRRWGGAAGDTLGLIVDADGDLWRALAQRGADDTLETPVGPEPARRVRVTFKRLSSRPRRKADFPDILSRELLSERGGLELWFPAASPELLLRGELARPDLRVGGEWTGD